MAYGKHGTIFLEVFGAFSEKVRQLNILVTGANGMVGRALCTLLEQRGNQVIRAVRKPTNASETFVDSLNENTEWDSVLRSNINVAVHLAGRVPPSNNGAVETPVNQYYQVNTLGTLSLARQCAMSGVKRFIFISTVKVLGEGKDEPYCGDDLAKPVDAYAISKWEAEQGLWQISAEMGMEVIVLRPPLVYGPSVKGNFFRLMQAIDKRHPLPFGAIHNQRSLIYLGNLVDIIHLCLVHPCAAGKTFLVSDGVDVSTSNLIREMSKALGCRPFLLPIPVAWMRWAGERLGKQAAVNRLTSSLAVDIALLRDVLGWRPPYTMQTGLEATAHWYRNVRTSV